MSRLIEITRASSRIGILAAVDSGKQQTSNAVLSGSVAPQR